MISGSGTWRSATTNRRALITDGSPPVRPIDHRNVNMYLFLCGSAPGTGGLPGDVAKPARVSEESTHAGTVRHEGRPGHRSWRPPRTTERHAAAAQASTISVVGETDHRRGPHAGHDQRRRHRRGEVLPRPADPEHP